MSDTQENPSPEPNLVLAKRLNIVGWILTVAVLGLVAVMRKVQIPLPEGVDLSFLPAVHASLNSLVAVFLVIGLVMAKRKNVLAHKRAISAAMICSILFLLCYVAYHFTTPETKFGGTGSLRTIYFVLLISHIILAAASFPFILFTWIYGFTNQIQKHRRMARYVFPVWLYVAVTGPVCYLMLRPYYGA
jgi:putative membrane protein